MGPADPDGKNTGKNADSRAPCASYVLVIKTGINFCVSVRRQTAGRLGRIGLGWFGVA